MPSNDLREINQRLQPLRRMLDDIAAAVDGVQRAEQSVANHRAQIPPLEAEIKKLSTERDVLKAQAASALRERDEAVAKAKADADSARTLAKAEQEKLGEALSKARSSLVQAEQAHRERMGVMRAEQAEAQKALELIQSELAAARRDAEARLTALRG